MADSTKTVMDFRATFAVMLADYKDALWRAELAEMTMENQFHMVAEFKKRAEAAEEKASPDIVFVVGKQLDGGGVELMSIHTTEEAAKKRKVKIDDGGYSDYCVIPWNLRKH